LSTSWRSTLEVMSNDAAVAISVKRRRVPPEFLS
jgi:hypothetical protein